MVELICFMYFHQIKQQQKCFDQEKVELWQYSYVVQENTHDTDT